jgi:hypothetical protein
LTKSGPMAQLQAVGGRTIRAPGEAGRLSFLFSPKPTKKLVRDIQEQNNQYLQDQNSMEAVRATSQDKLARLSVAQLQELCQQVGLEYEAPRGNAAKLLKRHIAELDESQQAEEGEQANRLAEEAQAEPHVLPRAQQGQPPLGKVAAVGPGSEDQITVQQLLSKVVSLQGTMLKLQESQNNLLAERELSKSWPDLSFDRPRDQHEWDALRDIAAELTPLCKANNLASMGVAKVQESLKAALDKVEKRAAMVYVGSHEGWATAAHIDDTAGTFLEEFKPQIKEARLKRKAEERGKGWFFRTGRSRAKKRKWDFSPAGARTSDFETGPSYQERMFPRDRGASNQLQFPSSSSSGSSSKPRKKPLACFNCGGPHYADKCPRRREQSSRAAHN